MALKTSLDYKYKPTVKYELELGKAMERAIGVLKVQWRTTSEELTERIDDFINLWMSIESELCHDVIGYVKDGNKFQRTFVLPENVSFSIIYISQAIGRYVRLFDKALKDYASGKLASKEDVEKFYKDSVYVQNQLI